MRKLNYVECENCFEKLGITIQVEEKLFENPIFMRCLYCHNEFIFNIDRKSFLDIKGFYNIFNESGFKVVDNPLNLKYEKIFNSDYIPHSKDVELVYSTVNFASAVRKYCNEKGITIISSDMYLTLLKNFNISINDIRAIRNELDNSKYISTTSLRKFHKLSVEKYNKKLNKADLLYIDNKINEKFISLQNDFFNENLYDIFLLNKIYNMKFKNEEIKYSFEDVNFKKLLNLHYNLYEYIMKIQIYLELQKIKDENGDFHSEKFNKYIEQFNKNKQNKSRTFSQNYSIECDYSLAKGIRNAKVHNDYELDFNNKVIIDKQNNQKIEYEKFRDSILELYCFAVNVMEI